MRLVLCVFRCRAVNRRAHDFAHDNCCLANTTALQLRSQLPNEDVIYVSYKNEVCLIVDHGCITGLSLSQYKISIVNLL